MTAKRTKPASTPARTAGGSPVTQSHIETWADEAERGYDLGQLRPKKVGRPSMGSGPADVTTVRLTPELRAALDQWAAAHGVDPSTVIRDALQRYLKAG